MQHNKLLPSILSADLLNLGNCLKNLTACDIDGIHFDVMDNHYVPNLTFGPLLLHAIKQQFPNLWVDVHLMIQPVMPLLNEFIKAKASQISFHLDASNNPLEIIKIIKDNNILAGIVINPHDNPNVLNQYAEYIDYVLIMTVQPGFAGQKLQNKAIDNIRYCKNHFPKLARYVDGGINLQNVGQLKQAGAEHFITGSAFFNNIHSYQDTLEQFYRAMDYAHKAT